MALEFKTYSYEGSLDADNFKGLLRHCTNAGASDILVQSGDYVWAEIHGRQYKATNQIIPEAIIPEIIATFWDRSIITLLRGGKGADRSLQLSGEADGLRRGEDMRFRVNFIQSRIAKQETGICITMRAIPPGIPDIKKMQIDETLFEGLFPAKGLVLVCGPTGSGKTTLQAAVYTYIGEFFPDRKIITFEDPIEFILGGIHCKGPQPAQSEIGRDIINFAEGLRNAMRRKPSIVGIGEIRDLETCDAAIEVGLTGHLCYATMHTDSVPETINRAIQIYPPAQQAGVASRMLGALRVIVVQRLLKTIDGKRVAIREYIIIDQKLQQELREINYEKWANKLQQKITGRSLTDKAWELFKNNKVERQEFVELAGWSEFIIRNEHNPLDQETHYGK